MKFSEKVKKLWDDRRTKKRNKNPGVVASPALLGAPHVDSKQPSTSNPAEPQAPPSLPSSTVPVASTSDGPSGLTEASLSEAILVVSSACATPKYPEDEECQLVNPEYQHTSKHSTSQNLWNAAYDDLEKSEDTADLVKSYINILNKSLSAETSDASAPKDTFIEPKTPAERQIYMRKLVEEGQEKLATTSKVTGGLQNVIEYVQKVKPVIDVAIGNIQQAALPWAGVSIGLQILSNPSRAIKSNLQGIVYVTSRMDWYCALSECLLSEDEPVESSESILKELKGAILTLYKALLLYQIKSACYYHQRRGLTVLRGLVNWDDWDGDLKKVKDAEQDVEYMSNQCQKEDGKSRLHQLHNSAKHIEESLGDIHQDLQVLIDQQQNIWTDSKNKKCLRDLFVVDPRKNMQTIIQNKEELVADAYKWIFYSDEYAAFTTWGNEASRFPKCRLLWIKGSAGTGKTMLLMGIIKELQSQLSVFAPRMSYFFYQATKNDLNNATNALRSLIWLLLSQQPRLIKHIQPEYDQMGRALFENEDAFNALDSVFENMLKDPCLLPTYLIIDALDECDKGLPLLLGLISKSFTLTDKVKWLVSSRPEVLIQQDIQREIHELESPDISRALVELDRERLGDPVNVYIECKLSALKGLTGYSNEVLTKISTEVRQRANNIFLWVALVFKELSGVRGWDAVETIKDMPEGLEGLYDRIMKKIERLSGARHCKNVLVAVSLAFRPLSFPELAWAASLPAGDDVTQTVVEECGSFLTITANTVSLIHQSAKDYLDKNHETLQPSGIPQSHMHIHERSIDAMSTLLKENIYGKDLDFDPSGMEIPNPDPLAPVRYACLFWVDHLSLSRHGVDQYDRIHSFLKSHILHWLEALSLMGKHDQSFRMINELEDISSSQSELHSLIYDATRFISKNAFIIEYAPIQLYSSAILFSPQASRIRSLFQQNIDGINVLSGLDSNWDRHIRTFDDKSKFVMYSHDGKSLIIISHHQLHVRVRNAMTGKIEHTLEGHSGDILTIALSPNGNLLASGSDDTTIRIWNMTTGQTESILEDHESSVRAIAFSPCGNFLATGAHNGNGNLRLWDIASGKTKHIFKVPHTVNTVLFSSSGKKLVAGSDDGTTWLWDVPSGQNERRHKGYYYPLGRVRMESKPYLLAIAPNELELASRADYNTIQVWDVKTWKLRYLLKGHSNEVVTILFSPGNKLLSGSEDGTIMVWDVETGHGERKLSIHLSLVSMALSLDGSRLVSYSVSMKALMEIWDTATWRNEGKLSHGANNYSVAISPNGQRLASASITDELRIWDIAPGLAEYQFEGHSDRVKVLAFSPDGSRLVSYSHDRTLRIWDVTTGQTERILPTSSWINNVAFSPDGSMLALVSRPSIDVSMVHIWDIATARIKHTLGECPETVFDLSFSPDGEKVALGNYKGAYLWNLSTGKLMLLLYDTWTHTVFSPDGEILALTHAQNNGIQLWNATTGQEVGFFTGHSASIITLVFSPDGRKLASASFDNTIRIWEVATGRIESMFDHRCSSLLFSPDGNKLASGSNWEIIMWNLATHQAEHLFWGHCASMAPMIFDLESDANGHVIDRVGNQPFYSINKHHTWVTRNGNKILYLPEEFRPQFPSSIAISDRTLAAENGAGRVTIIQFESAKYSQ